MPIGPFASSVGVGRAEPEWAALNKVRVRFLCVWMFAGLLCVRARIVRILCVPAGLRACVHA